MTRLRSNFQRGTLLAGISNADTSLSSNEFSTLPVVTAPDELLIALDPDAVHGNPELVVVTAHTSSATTVTVARAQEGTSARAHNSSTTWRHVPTSADFSAGNASLLYQCPAGFNWSSYDQVTLRILGDTTANPACGKFTPVSSTVVLDIDVEATGNYGGAWAPVELAVGVSASSASTPIFAALSFPQAAAAGVTEFQVFQVGHFAIDTSGVIHRRVFVTGLTRGREYTWQLFTGIEATSTEDVLADNPNFGHIAVSPDNNWLAVALWASDQVQIIRLGARPTWHFAAGASPEAWPISSSTSGVPVLGQFYSNTGAPIAVGDAPVDVKFSPDSTKLAVANFTACTVTFINVATGAVIGTSAQLHGSAATLNSIAWMADSSGVLACVSTADYYYVTAVASPVINHNGTLSFLPQWLKRKDAASTDSFWAVGNVLAYPMVFSTHTSTAALGALIQVSPTPSTGTFHPAVAKDTGEIWIPITGGTYDQQVMQATWGANADGSAAAIGKHYKPDAGHEIIAVGIAADARELWFTTADQKIGALRTSDGSITQSLFSAAAFETPAIHGFAGTAFTDLVMSDDGYIYFPMVSGTDAFWVHEWPSSTLTINAGALVSGNITVSAEGVQ